MKCITSLFLLLVTIAAFAQTDPTAKPSDTTTVNITEDTTITLATDTTALRTISDTAITLTKDLQSEVKTAKPKKMYPRNVLKVNIGSLMLFKNYNFVYERSLTRKISASVGYRTMPATQLSQLPALKHGYSLMGKDESTLEEDWSDIKASNKTITAEFRFYAGHKPGPRGFYLGLYGRYGKFDVDYNYTYETDTKNYLIPITSSTKALGGGLFFGVQWLIGKRVALDWQILGGHWGKLTGSGSGSADLSALTNDDRQNIKEDLESMLPSVGGTKTITANVNDNGVNLKIDGPFAGVRSGISLGIAF